MDRLKFLVVEQKIVNGTLEVVKTEKDSEFEAKVQWHYAMWYNGQDASCTEYTATVLGPNGAEYANEHVVKPVAPAEPAEE